MERKGILQFIKNCTNDIEYLKKMFGSEMKKIFLKAVLWSMYTHYKLTDIERHTNHEEKFFLLYISKNKLTFEELAESVFVRFDTFKNYVKFYNKTALEYIEKESKLDPSYKILLNAYQKSGL